MVFAPQGMNGAGMLKSWYMPTVTATVLLYHAGIPRGAIGVKGAVAYGGPEAGADRG